MQSIISLHQEQLMIICTEKCINNQLENNKIINVFTSKNELKKKIFFKFLFNLINWIL